MGQQETMTVAAEGKEGGALRRIILVLTVAALMAAVMVASTMPAMAKNSYQSGQDSPPGPPAFSFGPNKNGSSEVVHKAEGACVHHFGKNSGNKPLTGGDC
jgi:hypothetical protein